jgi:hypothetical protein
MRLITIRAPSGKGKAVAELAFEKGVKEVAIHSTSVHNAEGRSTVQDVVQIETATPVAKEVIEALMVSSFYHPKSYSFTVRHPESIFAAKEPKEEIHPIIRPSTDVYEELYQFTKVTISLAARVFLSAILLAYGMRENFLPLMIAGLLFLPYHHHMLGVGLGFCLQEWGFLKQAVTALLVSTVLIFLAGICVGLFTSPPIKFDISGSFLSGAILSAVIGLAAAIGSVDDAGRRELIGLAATAHISVYPAWLGLYLVFDTFNHHKVEEHAIAFLTNIAVLTVTAGVTYVLVKMKGEGIKRFIHSVKAQ